MWDSRSIKINYNLYLQLKNDNQALLSRIDDLEQRLRARVRPPRFVPIPNWIRSKSNLKFLIFACHPDRNKNKEAATEITKELLKLWRE